MNILIIAYTFGTGSAGNITYRIADEFLKQGHTIYVVSSDSNDHIKNVYQCKNILSDSSFLRRVIKKLYSSLTNDELKNYFWVRRAYRKSLNLIKENKVDVIYCRTSPLEACEVGYLLKQKTHIKTLLHFTDPEPSEYVIKNRWILKKELRKYKTIISSVDFISFGTKEMMQHQEMLMGIKFGAKAFISPDVSRKSTMCLFPMEIKEEIILVYLGTFGEYRNPLPLFFTIDKMNLEGYRIKLYVYSDKPRSLSYVSTNVVFKGRTNDIDKPLSLSNVLVDLDAEIENNPYISSKIKDYIPTNRPIIEITQKGSPIYNLVQSCDSIFLSSNCVASIAQNIKNAISYRCDREFYLDRLELIELFSPNRVVKDIIDRVEAV